MSDFSAINIAKQTIKVEIEALEALENSLNTDFEQVAQLIFRSKGRLVITGIGKSALVAQKIVATLNSTGTPALFMHAADAIHGDLGMMKTDDIVICISKSGETPEVKVLIPLVKNLGNLVVGMTSSLTSTLAQQADYTLHTPIEKEADPNNLAPTSSTTVQMVLGDALAISLLVMRGFTANDFARFHPGGSLGKQLYLRVSDLYIKNEKPQVSPTASLQEIIIEISSKRLGMTAVINEAKAVVGVITDGDLRRMLSASNPIQTLQAKDIMTKNPKTIPHDLLAVKALNVLRENSISQLIIVKNEQFEGVLHLHDLIREGII